MRHRTQYRTDTHTKPDFLYFLCSVKHNTMTAKKSTQETSTQAQSVEACLSVLLAEVLELKKLYTLKAKNALNINDLVLLTGLSKSRIYKLVNQRKIPYYKSEGGKTLWFERGEIENYLLHQKTPAVYELEQTAAKHCNTHKNKMLN